MLEEYVMCFLESCSKSHFSVFAYSHLLPKISKLLITVKPSNKLVSGFFRRFRLLQRLLILNNLSVYYIIAVFEEISSCIRCFAFTRSAYDINRKA